MGLLPGSSSHMARFVPPANFTLFQSGHDLDTDQSPVTPVRYATRAVRCGGGRAALQQHNTFAILLQVCATENSSRQPLLQSGSASPCIRLGEHCRARPSSTFTLTLYRSTGDPTASYFACHASLSWSRLESIHSSAKIRAEIPRFVRAHSPFRAPQTSFHCDWRLRRSTSHSQLLSIC